MYIFVPTWCMPDSHRGQKRVLDPMGLEIQMVVSCCCMLGMNTGPNYCPISSLCSMDYNYLTLEVNKYNN